ncbi:MAG: hypothetical protein RLY32_2284, partial [Pseudomonadota bacterium]
AIGGKPFTPLVGLLRGGLEQKQAGSRIEQIDPSLSKLHSESIVVKSRVIASKAQSKAPLAMQIAVTGSQVATAASERGDDFSIKGRRLSTKHSVQGIERGQMRARLLL